MKRIPTDKSPTSTFREQITETLLAQSQTKGWMKLTMSVNCAAAVSNRTFN